MTPPRTRRGSDGTERTRLPEPKRTARRTAAETKGAAAPANDGGPEARRVAESQRVALLAAQAGLDKKAQEVEIIDVTGKVDYADYLVLMTGQSDRHVTAIAGGVDELLSKNGIHAISVEGLPAARWVLIDFVDVVVHVFLGETRTVYDLDGLWMDARRVPVAETER